MMSTPRIILASGSAYRRELLTRLGLPFSWDSPDIDETPLTGEPVADMTARLAEGKARALSHRYPGHLIIGSDQSAELNGHPLGKPGTEQKAFEQLKAMSGHTITFHTALCLFDSEKGTSKTVVEPFRVTFRQLTDTQIHNYIKREQPLDCAGSFKSEGLGIVLFERFEGRDPNSLIGLPLMALTDLLAEAGVSLPLPAK